MEIKFRQWNPYKKVMCSWKEYSISMGKGLTNGHLMSPLMQFTGLEDKNGKEIYEGDILIESLGDDDYVIFKIIWNDIYDAGYNEIKTGNPNCVYDIRLNRSYSRHTIIGNIYKNPKMKTKAYWTKKKIKDALQKDGE